MGAAAREKADQALFETVLRLGDNALILGQELSKWTSNAPNVELDIALANHSLDLIGQARLLLDYAGKLEGKGRDEDTLAFQRDAWDFRNVLLVEQPNGDFRQNHAAPVLLCAVGGRLSMAPCRRAATKRSAPLPASR